MQIVRTIAELREAIAALRKTRGKVALVPTMGALHAGHMALVEEARMRAKHVVVSIFVNPKQFGPNEDLAAYPRRESADARMLADAGVAILWMPDVALMYPEGFATAIKVSGVTDGLDGAARPGHFDGVATVVGKLLHQVRPEIALFGEKDYQQLVMIRRMVHDLDWPVDIVGVPTQREDDGLAMSSRNAYLSPDERVAARALPRALGEAAAMIRRGDDVGDVLAAAVGKLREAGFDTVEYLLLCDAGTLEALDRFDRPARLLAAARMGKARLIDNLAVLPE